MNNDLIIGSHITMTGPDYFLGSVKSAISYEETAFMFYTGAPQNTVRSPLEKLKIKEGLELLKNSDIKIQNVIVHAPYLINLANTIKADIFDLSVNFLVSELKRTAAFGVTKIVLHPGAHLQAGKEKGLNQLIKGLDIAMDKDGTNVKICLETMAGKGSEIGVTFEDLAYVINNSKHNDRLGVCLDTCHINDFGYCVAELEQILNEFDRIIGLDKLMVIHLNDSKSERYSHKDRHENIGYGTIGFETLLKWAYEPRLKNVPKILETPYIDGVAPYKNEILMIRNKKFDANLKEKPDIISLF